MPVIEVWRHPPTDVHPVANMTTSQRVAVSGPDWDPSFHGSVHTATLAVCTVLVTFVVILGTFGNGIVLFSALQCRKLRSNFDVLVFNLAGADLIICSCLSPTYLYLLFSNPPSPREFCGGFLFAAITCGLLSLLTLVAIAAHRQSRVRGKVRSSLTVAKTTWILGSIYVICLGTAIGGTLHVFLAWDEGASTCQAVMNSGDITSNNVILFFISPIVVLSFAIIIFSYGIIARAVRIQTYMRVKALQPVLKAASYRTSQASVQQQSSNASKIPGVAADMQKILEEAPPHGEQHRLSKKSEPLKHCGCCNCMAALDKENKAVTMCLVVIVIITLCWAPLIVSHMIELITGESIILYQVKLCGIALVFLNSALNPYMYAQNNGRMKQRYGRMCWDMLHCECRMPASRRKFRTLTTPKPSPGTRTLRNPVIGADCATLQFLQPTGPQGATTVPKKHTTTVHMNIVKNTKVKTNHHHKKYTNNIVMFGSPHLNIPANQKAQEVTLTHTKKGHAQTGVKTLVQKTACCHADSPDDQSLIDS